MPGHDKNLKLKLLLLPLILTSCLLASVTAHAQEGETQIEDANLTDFPEITLRLRHSNGFSLSEIERLVVVEDGREISPTVVSATPLRVAFLVDVWQRGFPEDLSELIRTQLIALTGEMALEWRAGDQIAVFIPGGTDGMTLTPFQEWTTDLPPLLERLQAFPVDSEITPADFTTAINQLMLETLQQAEFEQDTESQKLLILVSNGWDGYRQDSIDDLGAIAQAAILNEVQVLMLSFPPPHIIPEGEAYLELFANLDEFSLQPLDNGELAADTLLTALKRPESELRFITSATEIPYQQTISIQGPAPEAKSEPLEISIAPMDFTAAINSSQNQFQPGDPVDFEITVASANHPLQEELEITEVEYRFDNGDFRSITNFDQTTTEPNGDRRVRFTAVADEATDGQVEIKLQSSLPGLVAVASELVPLNVTAPTPMPTATATPDFSIPPPPPPIWQVLWQQIVNAVNRLLAQPNLLNWLAVTLALLALLAALYALWFSHSESRSTSNVVPASVDSNSSGKTISTWDPAHGEQPPKAELVLIQGEGLLPELISLHDPVMSFGSEYREVDMLMISRYVSSVQFFIMEDQDGHYAIQNVPSAKNPTLVNGEEISSADLRRLDSGDVLQFGPIKYRFVSNLAGARIFREQNLYVPAIYEPFAYQTSHRAPGTLPPQSRTRSARRTRSGSLSSKAQSTSSTSDEAQTMPQPMPESEDTERETGDGNQDSQVDTQQTAALPPNTSQSTKRPGNGTGEFPT